eukprot:gene8676-9559_t
MIAVAAVLSLFFSQYVLSCLGALPPGVEFIGRFDPVAVTTRSVTVMGADWPASALRVRVRVKGSEQAVFKVHLGDDPDFSLRYYLGVLVDSQPSEKFLITADQRDVTFLLPRQEEEQEQERDYVVSFMRLNEASYGEVQGRTIFEDLSVEGAAVLPLPSRDDEKKRHTPSRLLYLGDSFTAAYGVDGSPPCSFSASTEDVRHSHAFLTAQAVEAAELQVIAWSGKGVVRNYGDANPTSSCCTLPDYYNRTIATNNASYYSPSRYAADVAVIMLGTNDFSTSPQPDPSVFSQALASLSLTVQKDYHCPVLLLCAPLAAGEQCNAIEKAAQLSASSYFSIPDEVFDGGAGCDGHPNQQTEKNMAQYISPLVQDLLAKKKRSH